MPKKISPENVLNQFKMEQGEIENMGIPISGEEVRQEILKTPRILSGKFNIILGIFMSLTLYFVTTVANFCGLDLPLSNDIL